MDFDWHYLSVIILVVGVCFYCYIIFEDLPLSTGARLYCVGTATSDIDFLCHQLLMLFSIFDHPSQALFTIFSMLPHDNGGYMIHFSTFSIFAISGLFGHLCFLSSFYPCTVEMSY